MGFWMDRKVTLTRLASRDTCLVRTEAPGLREAVCTAHPGVAPPVLKRLRESAPVAWETDQASLHPECFHFILFCIPVFLYPGYNNN